MEAISTNATQRTPIFGSQKAKIYEAHIDINYINFFIYFLEY